MHLPLLFRGRFRLNDQQDFRLVPGASRCRARIDGNIGGFPPVTNMNGGLKKHALLGIPIFKVEGLSVLLADSFFFLILAPLDRLQKINDPAINVELN